MPRTAPRSLGEGLHIMLDTEQALLLQEAAGERSRGRTERL